MSDIGETLLKLGVTCPHSTSRTRACGRPLRLEQSGGLRCKHCNRTYEPGTRSLTSRDHDGDLVYEVVVILKEVYGT